MADIEELMREYATRKDISRLDEYFRMMVTWNESVNLTAIIDRESVYVKHFWDSLSVMKLQLFRGEDAARTAIDIGTGAGFPGIPLAIVNPKVEFTLCDALRKRTVFLNTVAKELCLRNVTVVHARSEDLARNADFRNRYDVVMARAVAKLNILSELLVPFARPGGHVVCYKGPGIGEELKGSRRAFEVLGVEEEFIKVIDLPEGYGKRSLVVLKVLGRTPKKYPRKAGILQKQPL